MTLRFGTDGVRGVANTELTPELAVAFARASVSVLARDGGVSRFLVARDTRESGDMLEAAVAAGLCSAGAEVMLCGVIPTPALSCLVPEAGASGGIMISASHNPYEYNGLKFIDHAGDKLSEAEEAAIESCAYEAECARPSPLAGRVGRANGLVTAYAKRLRSFAPAGRIHGVCIVVDCAHGALSELAPRVLTELGAGVIPLNCSPTGTNINDGGAVKPQRLAEEVRQHAAVAGLAFDGDGDRLVMVDEKGAVIDGDQILGIWAKDLAARGALADDLVVGTVLTNGGLELFLSSFGCRLLRAPVGDRYVAAQMAGAGAALGGETCGHIIYAPHLSSSDALLTGIAILGIVARSGMPLSALAAAIAKRPQVSLNLPMERGHEILDDPDIRLAVSEAEGALGLQGRVVVRPSGTEPVVRITCACDDERQARAVAEELATVVERCADRERAHADIAA
jgi:phosphoglucosamine mutase